MLKTENLTPAVGNSIVVAARAHDVTSRHHINYDGVFFEHGQWWLGCSVCGCQWSVVDAEGGQSVDGFDFEEVSEGDGFCAEEG